MKYAFSIVTLLLLIGYVGYKEYEPEKAEEVSVASDEPMGFPTEEIKQLATTSVELPEALSFAGEEVPLQIIDVKERLDREIHINTYWHNNSIFIIKRANRWLPQIEKILEANGIPDDFKYLTVIESGLLNVISPKQAVGFWQFLKPTAKEWGLEVTKEVDERYHPLKSTEAACKYLKRAHAQLGSWTLAAASYNRGIQGVQNRLNEQKVTSYYDLLLTEETARYVFRILACKELLQSPKKYGFNIPAEHLYQPEELVEISVDRSIDDLVGFAKEQGINYKILKKHNPWLRKPKLTVRSGKSYVLSIPRKQSATSLGE